MKNVLMGLVLTFGLMVSALDIAWAQDFSPEMIQRLQLSPEQHKKLESNKRHRGKELDGLRKKQNHLRKMIREELQKESIDREKIKRLNNELKIVQNQLADLRVNGIVEVREILTPNQFNQFKSFVEQGR